jgi:uncharacterized membrane protein
MTIDPLIKRIVVDPPAPVPSSGARILGVLSLTAFIGTVLYAKWVAPQAIEQQIKKDMFSTPAPSSH